MSTTRISIVIGVIVLILLIAGGLYWHASTVDAADKSAVNSVVTNFGQQLQMVSLLAPNASTTIASTYGTYVTPALLESWEADPQSAPGRQTSSPWPDHIDITSVQKTSSGYDVQGNLILMTSNEVEHGGNAGSEAVTMQLVKSNGQWLVSSYQSSPNNSSTTATSTPVSTGANPNTSTSTVTTVTTVTTSTSSPAGGQTSHVFIPAGGAITISGTTTCLPPKDPSLPHTMECALGFEDVRGNYYALVDTDPNYKNTSGVAENSQVTIHGTFTPGSSAQYNIVGTIAVTSITK